MNVPIETYRGIDIIFNTESERFSFSLDEGSWRDKQSYAACKKNIDDFHKINSEFNPFKIRRVDSGKAIEVVAIRKDGRFVYKDFNGQLSQIADYEIKYYVLYDDAHDAIYSEADELSKKAEEFRVAAYNKINTVVGVSLQVMKDKYMPPK